MDSTTLNSSDPVIQNMSTMPGNAEGGTWLPDFLNPDKPSLVASAWKQLPDSWDSWKSSLLNTFTFGASDAYSATKNSAASMVQEASTAAKNLVTSAENAVVSSATFAFSWTKWLVIGLGIFLALYVLSMFGGVLPKKWRLG